MWQIVYIITKFDSMKYAFAKLVLAWLYIRWATLPENLTFGLQSAQSNASLLSDRD